MPRNVRDGYNQPRYSVRASLTLWMAIAGAFWVSLLLFLTFVIHRPEDTLEAAAKNLSTIAPAAGPAMNEPDESSPKQ